MKRVVKASLGSDLDKYQKWVDYDMKRYGKISDTTNEDIRKAGLKVVKDKYGDYEVIASTSVKCGEIFDDFERFIETVESTVVNLKWILDTVEASPELPNGEYVGDLDRDILADAVDILYMIKK